MKILVISNYYPPYYIGGYELACFDTVEYLKKQGHEVSVLTGNFKKESIQVESIYRKLKYINYENPSFMDKHQVENYNYNLTKEMIEQYSPDLVYFWSLRLVSLSPVIAVQESNIRKVFEIGDLWMKGYLQNTFFSRFKRFIKNILPFTISTKVELSPAICVSHWIAKEMRTKYASKQVFVIPNGTKLHEKDKKILNRKRRYLFSGRNDYSKGLDLALKALGNIKEQGSHEFTFDIYGAGNEAYIKKCKNIVNVLNLNEEVNFCGHKSDMQKHYSQYDVLLMPTRMREPFGLVVIEAMAAGVVVIATDGYGPAEIISKEKDGLLFKSEDVEDLTYKIKQLHENPLLYQNLRNEGYEKVINQFELTKVKKEVEKVLLHVSLKRLS